MGPERITQISAVEVELTNGAIPLFTEEQATVELEFDEHGSLPDSYMMEHYGLTSEEGRQLVEFGTYKGTFAQMVSDDKCPVGRNMRNAHAEEGFAGTQRTIEGLKMMAPNLKLEVAPKTSEHYTQARAPEPKKKVIPSQIQP